MEASHLSRSSYGTGEKLHVHQGIDVRLLRGDKLVTDQFPPLETLLFHTICWLWHS